MPWRVQLKAKYGKALETEFARIFEALPKKGKGVALVEKETEIVLTFIAESEEEAKAMEREAQAGFEKQGLKFETSVTDLGK
jgi:hypothetical protein